MSKDLANRQLAQSRKDTPPLTEEEIQEYLGQLPEWKVTQQGSTKVLQRLFIFKNFAAALEYTDKVGALAEEADHHPSLLTEWGKVTVNWWTHSIGGLHENDFIMAARSDEAYASTSTG